MKKVPKNTGNLRVWVWTPATAVLYLVTGLGIYYLPIDVVVVVLALAAVWITAIIVCRVCLSTHAAEVLFYSMLPSGMALCGGILAWTAVTAVLVSTDLRRSEVISMGAISLFLLLFGSFHITDAIVDEVSSRLRSFSKRSNDITNVRSRVFEDRNISDTSSLIRFPRIDTKENYLGAFWQWVSMMADDRYDRAAKAFLSGSEWEANQLKKRVTTFFGGNDPWSVVIPNDRLIGVIESNMEYSPMDENGRGWFMAQIPLTTEPNDPKADDIPLMGLAVSFIVIDRGEHYELFFEIFHA